MGKSEFHQEKPPIGKAITSSLHVVEYAGEETWRETCVLPGEDVAIPFTIHRVVQTGKHIRFAQQA
ncbi:MAG: hypothetical protein LBC19_06400 [Tannerella sp.]|nr:hypothetical protein [Tannerella sp.]